MLDADAAFTLPRRHYFAVSPLRHYLRLPLIIVTSIADDFSRCHADMLLPLSIIASASISPSCCLAILFLFDNMSTRAH